MISPYQNYQTWKRFHLAVVEFWSWSSCFCVCWSIDNHPGADLFAGLFVSAFSWAKFVFKVGEGLVWPTRMQVKIFDVGFDEESSLQFRYPLGRWLILECSVDDENVASPQHFSLLFPTLHNFTSLSCPKWPRYHLELISPPSFSIVPVGKNGKSTVRDLQPYRGMA